MKRHIGFLAFAAVVLFIAGCQDDTPLEPNTTSPSFSLAAAQSVQGFEFEYADHYIMGYDYVSPEAADIVEAAGGSYETSPTGYGVVRGISEDDAEELENVDGIRSMTRDIIVQWIPDAEEFGLETSEAPSTESDQSGAFFFGFQWNMRQIDADDAWLSTNQGAGASVAILDTGIDPGHFSLIGKVDVGNSASTLTFSPCGAVDEGTILDFNFHGTFVGALVSATGIDMASVAPDATLIAVKVLACDGFGSFADVNAGIIHAANVGADVINMSLGLLIPQDTDNDAFNELVEVLIDATQAAIDFAVDNGVFVVAAAGNDGLNFDDLPEFFDELDFIHIPSMLDDVLSVAATGPFQQANFDQLAFYTNFGQHGADVVAPGGNFQAGGVFQDGILSACSGFSLVFPICGTGTFYLLGANGTSFASPHAAGTAAVAISEGEDPDDCVEDGADRIDGSGNSHLFSRGRINVLGAAQCDRLTTD